MVNGIVMRKDNSMDKVWLLAIEHRHGTDHWVCATEAIALSCVDNHVQRWWEDEIEDEDMPTDPDERTERYFSVMEERDQPESYYIEELPVLVALPDQSDASEKSDNA